MKASSLRAGKTKRVLLWLVVSVVSCGLMLAGGLTHAVASTADPTLTLTLLETQNNADSILPGSSNPPAGPGYIYKAVKLNRGKINLAAADLASSPETLQKNLTSAVIADPDSFKDSSNTEFYGVSDTNGVITTSSTTQPEGIWLEGAQLDVNSATLSGGTAAHLGGTEEEPTYWMVSLVAAPHGVTVRTDPCVVQLPTLVPGGSPTFQVDVYPKLDISKSDVVPGSAVSIQHLSKTGSSLILPLILLAVFLVLGVVVLVMAVKKRHDTIV